MPHVHQLNVNPNGGVPKYAVAEARIEVDHVVGDKQRHLKFHGGPMRAVCLYSLERIAELQDEGHPVVPGSTGENLTISGLDWPRIVPGVRLSVGREVVLEITAYAVPCNQIAGSFEGCTSDRISQKLFQGWARVYAKVLSTGVVHTGDAVGVC